ncbi:hypothetical protein KCQ_05671 [Pectobacterium atrosepticum ICMP 1526]|uniref:hypothetical protein n=1 Tax=Pectobacterium atrosepticum TaxID=29471 RepID=UPI000500CB8A|nr:hypothetical protein [Pectobacterium atrosepticum]KFX10698.1 hypothetical protein JV34_22490 [Pectobacterium atrosepticum]KMK87273.1 hypothetical protein KCQ_05671 [Pectobacterium atrosepticum ICMP 1526]
MHTIFYHRAKDSGVCHELLFLGNAIFESDMNVDDMIYKATHEPIKTYKEWGECYRKKMRNWEVI